MIAEPEGFRRAQTGNHPGPRRHGMTGVRSGCRVASVCRVENLLERAKVAELAALRGLDEGRSIRALQIHGSSFLVQVSGVAARVRSLRTLAGAREVGNGGCPERREILPDSSSTALVNITIRSVPDEVRNELAARAKRSGRSLQEYLTAELARIASTPSPDDTLARIREHARSYPRVSTAEILDARDADRR